MKVTTISALAIAVLVVTAALLSPIGAQGVSGGSVRVAVCDFGKVYNNYDKTKALQKKLDENLSLIKDEDEKRTREIQRIKEALKSYNERSPDYERQFNDFITKTAEHRTWMDVQKAKSQRWHLMMTTEMFNEIKNAIKAVAQDKGIDIVLQTHQLNFDNPTDVNELFQRATLHKVLYNSDQVDITDLTLTKVNAAFKKGQK
jgi:Skp family chaperone for outer membrane proteins